MKKQDLKVKFSENATMSVIQISEFFCINPGLFFLILTTIQIYTKQFQL